MKKLSLMKSKKFVIYAEKNLLQIKMIKRHLKYIIKLGIVVIAQENLEATHGICNLKCKIPKEIPVVAHNASYDQRFITRQLAKKFKGQFECLGENSEKYITFSVLIKKELDNRKTIAHKLRFIDSSRFMSTSLSSLVDNVSEICSRKCKDKNCK